MDHLNADSSSDHRALQQLSQSHNQGGLIETLCGKRRGLGLSEEPSVSTCQLSTSWWSDRKLVMKKAELRAGVESTNYHMVVRWTICEERGGALNTLVHLSIQCRKAVTSKACGERGGVQSSARNPRAIKFSPVIAVP